jgi:hypothetical protein
LSGRQWFDPLGAGLRSKWRGFIKAILEEELSQVLARDRHARRP